MTLTRDERDRFTANTPTDIAYGEGACLETPPGVFQRLNERFKFDVDLTANEQNHLLPTWFGPGSPNPDCLVTSWTQPFDGHACFLSGYSNPAYGPFIPSILTKAILEREKGFTSVFLLPNRAGGWFQDLVIPYYSELWYCASRLTFFYQGRPRLSAAVTATKAYRNDPRFNVVPGMVLAAHDTTVVSFRHDGVDYAYGFAKGEQIMAPAGALFDSIIVVYRPLPSHDRGLYGNDKSHGVGTQGFLFPAPQRPNVWDPRSGELRY